MSKMSVIFWGYAQKLTQKMTKLNENVVMLIENSFKTGLKMATCVTLFV